MPSPAPLPDPTVRLAAAGDAGARRAMVHAYGPRVWSLCRRLSPDPEDDYQEIWAKVFRGLAGFDPAGEASLATWIAVLAHRHLVDRHRRRRVRGEVLPFDDLATVDDVEGRLDARRRAERLGAALDGLPIDQRTVVVLHHLEGVALDDIARVEGVALGTVKSRLHRARARLLALLEGR